MDVMLKPNQTLAKLRRGEPAYGTSIHEFPLPGTVVMLQKAGYDFCHIDCEHSGMDLSQVREMVRAGRNSGIDCLVRVSRAVPHLVARMLDIGVDGVVIPHVDTREDAERVVETAKYQPFGHRGVGYGGLNVGYDTDVDLEEFIAHANENLMIVAMIESQEGVENIEEIVSVPGIDATLIGPADFSTSYGLPGHWEDPTVEEAIQRVVDASTQHGVASGIHLISVPALHAWRERGMRFLMYNSDIRMFAAAAQADVAELRA